MLFKFCRFIIVSPGGPVLQHRAPHWSLACQNFTNISDSWIWRHDIGVGYSVRGACSLLTTRDVVTTVGASDLIWHKHVPLKVSVLAWRLLRNRLPTKDNLVERHIIPLDDRFCVNGCGQPETANHLFLLCLVFAPLWTMVWSWLGIAPADT
ncbi:hypothetical protein TSUD_326630 [Trifolium subterraneum]|uniref:Reverse transcriptase zinc-binding domain-containing protein n=1 Tax=Trifolium subterraneum TaxID=3900 RepID=A0A2Z6N1G2_TRISU|nr:hypothetical protein TSUD_326630 [Trifolium subterraneum]